MFARRKAKTKIRQRDWLTLVGEKNHRKQVGTVPTFFCSREQIRQVENGAKECRPGSVDYIRAAKTAQYQMFFSSFIFHSRCACCERHNVNAMSLSDKRALPQSGGFLEYSVLGYMDYGSPSVHLLFNTKNPFLQIQ